MGERKSNIAIWWVRQDFRLHDNPALIAAARAGEVLPVYVLDDETPAKWRIGAAQRWWLHHAILALDADLRVKGSRLLLRRGAAAAVIENLLRETGATHVHATRQYEPWWVAADASLGEAVTLHDGNRLAPIEEVVTGAGTQFKVYGAFWKALADRLPPPEPLAIPEAIKAPARWPKSDVLTDWNLLPIEPDWAKGFADWTPGETGATNALRDFADEVVHYDIARNLPAVDGTSRLSPHLHFGEISSRQIWHALAGRGAGVATFRKELAWRDFAAGLTLALPKYGNENGRTAYDKVPWRRSAADLRAWQRGLTGYPIVDAGMRELWATGWMHNRVRMITASFLVKHLLIDWREGERWFWDCLVDADYANNAVNWQWVAGTGTDANMWGRIMAPLSQSEKFAAGGYIRQWVPELRDVPDPAIHDPEAAGCRPDAYPPKIVGHREGRERALAAGRLAR